MEADFLAEGLWVGGLRRTENSQRSSPVGVKEAFFFRNKKERASPPPRVGTR